MSREAKKGYDYTKLPKKWAKHLPIRDKTGDVNSDMMKIFLKLFEGIGKLPVEYKIEFKSNAKLSAPPCQKHPRSPEKAA